MLLGCRRLPSQSTQRRFSFAIIPKSTEPQEREEKGVWARVGAEARPGMVPAGPKLPRLSCQPLSITTAGAGGGTGGTVPGRFPVPTAGRRDAAAGSGSWKEFFTWEFEQKRLNEGKMYAAL